MAKKFWTKSKVAKMTMEELIQWNNKCCKDLDEAKKYEVEIPNTELAYELVRAELTKRKLI